MLSRPEAAQAPQIVLGKYRLFTKLGQGGMGDVYLAAAATGSEDVGQLVVIKRLRNIEDPQHVAMFINEARIAKQLAHPNIVQTHEVGREGGDHLLVMEYLQGPTLWRLRRSAAERGMEVPPAIEIEILLGVLEGLHYAHELRAPDGRLLHVVHRDLSSENVIITQLGESKILDFGIAKTADSVVQTQAGFVKGKVQTMPPEQLRGHAVDQRADIFAAGVMLWEGVAQRSLWGTLGNVAISSRLVQEDLPSLSELGPHVPEDLRRICEQAIAARPEKRFGSALAMKAALMDYVRRHGLAVSRAQVADYVEPLFREERERLEQIIRAQMDHPSMRFTAIRSSPRPGAALPSSTQPTVQASTPASAAPPLTSAVLFSPPPPLRNSASKWAALLAAAGLAAAGGIWYVQTRPAPAPGEVGQPPGQRRSAGDEAAAKYLAAAEQLAARKGYEAARGLLAKAAATDITEPDLNIRLARLRDTLDTAALLQEASAHVDGERWRAAIDAAKKALDRHPENAEALAIVATARRGQALAEASAHERRRGHERESHGKRGAAGARIASREPGSPAPGEEPPAVGGAAAVATREAAVAAPAVSAAPAKETPAPPPAKPPEASATPPPRVLPSPVGPAAPARAGAVFSAPPPAKLPPPALPRVYVPADGAELRRMCARVESTVTSLAGVSPEYARGITGRMQAVAAAGAEIYPVAMFYFIVREAALKHDSATAANGLAAAHRDGRILRLKDLPAVESGH